MCADVSRVDRPTAAQRSSRGRSGGSRAAGTGAVAGGAGPGGSSTGQARAAAAAATRSSTPVLTGGRLTDARYAAAVPERSLAQQMGALALANDVRCRRAQLKRDVKAGRADVLAVLLEPPVWCETMKVFDLLLAVPKLGRVRVNACLVGARVSPSKTVGGLSARQRAELARFVARRGARP